MAFGLREFRFVLGLGVHGFGIHVELKVRGLGQQCQDVGSELRAPVSYDSCDADTDISPSIITALAFIL